MGVDDPDFSLLEDAEEVLIADEVESDDDMAEGVGETDSLHDFSLIGEDADVFEWGVILPEGEDLGLIGSYGDLSTVAGHSDQHVFVTQPIEPLPERILREEVTLVPVLATGEVVPIVVHNIWLFIQRTTPHQAHSLKKSKTFYNISLIKPDIHPT